MRMQVRQLKAMISKNVAAFLSFVVIAQRLHPGFLLAEKIVFYFLIHTQM